GGARHISFGVPSTIDVGGFLGIPTGPNQVRHPLVAEPANGVASERIEFAYNPDRRGGEWTIADQAGNRYSLWSENKGFPNSYNPSTPPIIYLAKTTGGKF